MSIKEPTPGKTSGAFTPGSVTEAGAKVEMVISGGALR